MCLHHPQPHVPSQAQPVVPAAWGSLTFPQGCSCTLSPPASPCHFPGCPVPPLQPGTFLQRNLSFPQKTHQVIKINLKSIQRTFNKKMFGYLSTTSLQKCTLTAHAYLYVSEACNLETLRVNCPK